MNGGDSNLEQKVKLITRKDYERRQRRESDVKGDHILIFPIHDSGM